MNQFARPGLAVTQLPSFNDDDKGKVLTINSESGALGWEESSGGGGSSGGVYTANITWSEDFSSATLDKTWQEIHDACTHGPVFLLDDDEGARLVYTVYKVAQMLDTGKYTVFAICGPDSMQFQADTNTGYPAFSDNQ